MIKYIDEYLDDMAITLSDSTVRGHRSTLNNFMKHVDADEPVAVTVKEVVQYRNSEYEKKTVGTVNTQLKRVKQFFDWCVENKYTDASPASNVGLLTEGETVPKWLDERQEDLLLKSARIKYLGTGVAEEDRSYRELAIIYLMLKAGLRVGEVSNLKLEEIQIIDGSGKMLIRGKQRQQRTVPLIPEAIEAIQKYIEKHGTKGEYLFYSQRSDKLSVRAIQNIVAEFKSVEQGNVTLRDITPHVLRHTFAHNLANGGMALESIARVMGHMKENGEPNIQQTIRYTKASQDEIGDEMSNILSYI